MNKECNCHSENNSGKKLCHDKKHRDEAEHKKLLNRLSRIEGQIRGIRKMVENDQYCIDILMQVAAAGAALDSFSKEILTEHIKTCVVEDIENGKHETADELCAVLKRLMRG